MYKIPKGEAIPQTIENLQEIMAKDAEVMLKQSMRLIQLNRQIWKLQQRLLAARTCVCAAAQPVIIEGWET